MANIAHVTQSALELLTSMTGTARVTQSAFEFLVGVSIACGNPPPGQVNSFYTHTFPAGGGEAPLAFAIIAGALPFGVSLNAATGIASGIPTQTAIFAFTVQVTDAFGATAAVNCSIQILPLQSAVISGGYPQGIQGCRPRNEADWCMFAEFLLLREITFPLPCALPRQYRACLPWGDDFGANATPEGAAPLHKTGGIVTPAPAAGDQVILETRIPLGYDGLLAGIFHYYTGSGFEQGSGDILWRIQINQRYIENLGNIAFTLGSPISPLPLTEGQIVFSGQTIRYIVNVPNLSGMIQVGQSQIAAGLIGFLWPR